jgi:repressor LexA
MDIARSFPGYIRNYCPFPGGDVFLDAPPDVGMKKAKKHLDTERMFGYIYSTNERFMLAAPVSWQEVLMMMVRKSKGLSERHIRVLEFLTRYQTEHGRPPSIREIGDAAQISSTSVVNYYLEQLEKMGYIERDGRVSRGLRLTDKVNEVVQVITDLMRVPVMGRIVASAPVPVPASDFNYYDVETSVEIATSLLPAPDKNKQLFALEVDGDSMIDAMVNDGDYVIMKPVDSNAEVRNGEMVAVWLPNRDETTLKYFYKERDGYRLQPANPTMQPILIDKEEPLEVKGKVVMVIRRMEMVPA